MNSDKCLREEANSPVSNVDPQDGCWITGRAGRSCDHKQNRKAKQLCRQVSETLDLVLSGNCRDELLQSLHVVSVVPAPNSSRLLVTVFADLPAELFDRQEILERLDNQTGRLRAEVAASINRKRVPSLVFHVLGRPSSIL
jgi:ribosome-binding factor A